jgi:hypothetical protein
MISSIGNPFYYNIIITMHSAHFKQTVSDLRVDLRETLSSDKFLENFV